MNQTTSYRQMKSSSASGEAIALDCDTEVAAP